MNRLPIGQHVCHTGIGARSRRTIGRSMVSDNSPYLSPSERTGRAVPPEVLYKALRKAIAKTESAKYSPHDLRRTFATHRSVLWTSDWWARQRLKSAHKQLILNHFFRVLSTISPKNAPTCEVSPTSKAPCLDTREGRSKTGLSGSADPIALLIDEHVSTCARGAGRVLAG